METELTSDFITCSIRTDIEQLDFYGTTSLAYKTHINGQTFFIKKLRPELRNDERYRHLFYKEFNTGKKIHSPYIVKYLSIRENDDELCIVMEYVNGQTLKQKIENEPGYFRKPENMKRLLLQLCEALAAIHKENVVHLDLNPSNIIISQANNNLKLIDFGFCLSDYSDQTTGTTAKFAAPEATMSQIKEIDARTDIYSIGRLLQYIEEKSGAKLPRYIRRIKRGCLHENKQKRYCSAEDVIGEILNRNRSKRKSITLLAITVALLTPFAVQGYKALENYIAWESGEIGSKFEERGIYYRITDHEARTVEVTYKGNTPDEFEFEYNDGEIIIPPTVSHRGRSFRVTSIASGAFDNPETTRIILPDGMESIKDNAFFSCRLTGTVHIPKTVTEIGEWVFNANTCTDSLVVDVRNPKYDSRGNCNAIIETATNTLMVACANTVIPDDVTAIGDDAFVLFQQPTIVIPPSVKSIGKYAFYNSAVKEITLPDSLTVIGECAFQLCRKLQKVTLSKNLKHIEAEAFELCEELKEVVSHIPTNELQPTGKNCFKGINSECVLYVPKGAKSCYESMYGWNCFSRIIEME